MDLFKQKSPLYEHLKDKWVGKHKTLQERLLTEHKDAFEWISKNSKQIAVGSLAGLFLVATPMLLKHTYDANLIANAKAIDRSAFLVSDLHRVLPEEVRPLEPGEEKEIGNILSRTLKMDVSAELDGKRLNRSYGLIGAEQHLARFPGDTMAIHLASDEESRLFYSSGMAPGLGGWGYFANSQQQMTKEENMREKYYIAVQSFLSPGFNENPRELLDFLRFRKMLVVNPQNGKAVVVVIGDAGPAAWTGKHLGGSPEVMKYLERVDGRQVGAVLYYFIDDPKNQIPLGPIEL